MLYAVQEWIEKALVSPVSPDVFSKDDEEVCTSRVELAGGGTDDCFPSPVSSLMMKLGSCAMS